MKLSPTEDDSAVFAAFHGIAPAGACHFEPAVRIAMVCVHAGALRPLHCPHASWPHSHPPTHTTSPLAAGLETPQEQAWWPAHCNFRWVTHRRDSKPAQEAWQSVEEEQCALGCGCHGRE